MTLRDWLDANSKSNAQLAEKIGRTAEAVRRYAAGDRIPDRETMPLIVDATGGQVTANDFFGIEDAPESAAADLNDEISSARKAAA